jgi:hypothetical protein
MSEQRAAEPSDAAAKAARRTSSSPGAAEKRKHPRFKLACPVRIHRDGDPREIETHTEDISCDGFFCRSDHAFLPHEHLDCEVLIPGSELHSAAGGQLVMSCRVEVVRLVPAAPQAKSGIACRVEDYSIRVQLDSRK